MEFMNYVTQLFKKTGSPFGLAVVQLATPFIVTKTEDIPRLVSCTPVTTPMPTHTCTVRPAVQREHEMGPNAYACT